jgi:hypothetical protein
LVNCSGELTTKGAAILGQVLSEATGVQRTTFAVAFILVIINSTGVRVRCFLAWWGWEIGLLLLLIRLMRGVGIGLRWRGSRWRRRE